MMAGGGLLPGALMLGASAELATAGAYLTGQGTTAMMSGAKTIGHVGTSQKKTAHSEQKRIEQVKDRMRRRKEPMNEKSEQIAKDIAKVDSGDVPPTVSTTTTGRLSQNARWAGKTYPLPSKMAKKHGINGIDFTPQGFPNFSPVRKG
jgi:hypothetical protein